MPTGPLGAALSLSLAASVLLLGYLSSHVGRREVQVRQTGLDTSDEWLAN